MSFFILLLLSIVPRDDVVRESVDLIELNHFYDEQGRLVFDQVIFYDWAQVKASDRGRDVFSGQLLPPPPIAPGTWRFQVDAWRLVKSPEQLPVRDWDWGGYRAFWLDGEVPREVWSPGITESWLQYDVELVEREILQKEARRELRSPKRPVQSRR